MSRSERSRWPDNRRRAQFSRERLKGWSNEDVKPNGYVPPVSKDRAAVLVVDDHEDTLALEQNGFRALGAGSIAEARAFLSSHEDVDVLVADYFPDGTGAELTKLCGEGPPKVMQLSPTPAAST